MGPSWGIHRNHSHDKDRELMSREVTGAFSGRKLWLLQWQRGRIYKEEAEPELSGRHRHAPSSSRAGLTSDSLCLDPSILEIVRLQDIGELKWENACQNLSFIHLSSISLSYFLSNWFLTHVGNEWIEKLTHVLRTNCPSYGDLVFSLPLYPTCSPHAPGTCSVVCVWCDCHVAAVAEYPCSIKVLFYCGHTVCDVWNQDSDCLVFCSSDNHRSRKITKFCLIWNSTVKIYCVALWEEDRKYTGVSQKIPFCCL